ncbi:hypothetical protein V5N11_027755 [Cardamine amara subsp. amara]|uniref:Yos1-like protein n=1 Tax=Cardamine amara subsp. amara TaxID=228776 RepID=A0ABD0ZMT7_CARAN
MSYVCPFIEFLNLIRQLCFPDSDHFELYASQGTMFFWTLIKGLLLFANALAILNEDRFLAPRGWTLGELHQTGRKNSAKGQIIGLIHACQYMRFPLMLINTVVILWKLVSG